MAYELLTALLLSSLFVFVVILRWVHCRRKIFRTFKEQGIPGPEPSFLTGNMHQLKAGLSPNDVISQWIEQYGNVFGYFVGEVPHLIVKDLNFLKQALIKDFSSNFSSRSGVLLDIEPMANSLVAMKGQRWKDVRGVLSPSFSSGKIKLMTTIMNQNVTTMIELVEQKASAGEMFDIYELMQGLTLDVIALCALAMKVNCLGDPKDPFLLAVRNFVAYAQQGFVEYAFMFRFLASITTFIVNYFTAEKMTTMVVKNLKEVITHRRKNFHSIHRTDLLQLLLDTAGNRDGSVDGLSHSAKNVILTDDSIIANAYLFLLAGYETTSTALGFTFYLLVQHPEVQDKLYEEIVSNVTNDQWSYESIESLKYLDQVFNESLRLYPPVTGFVTRECIAEYKFGDIVVPEGTVLQAPVWDIHHDPEFWPDPWKFDPDRFAPENKNNINSMAFLAFGVGPRNCIGSRFAQLEAKLAISRLVQKFRFVPCEKTENPLELRKPCPTMIINPANGVYLQAVPRNSSVS